MECTFGPFVTRNLIRHVLTICHLKLMQSTGLEQKRFDLWSLSPTLCNLWLLLVNNINLCFLRKARLQEEQFWSQDNLALEKQLLLWVKWSLSLSLLKLLPSNLQNGGDNSKETYHMKTMIQVYLFYYYDWPKENNPEKKMHFKNTSNEKYTLQKVCESSFIWILTGFHLQIWKLESLCQVISQ